MKKKALVSSILTIALCVCLIAGSTLALFTSESTVNVAVTAGKVKVVASVDEESVVYKSELSGDDTLGHCELSGNSIKLDRIVPGDYLEFDIHVDNESNVAIQYRTVIELSVDGLEVTIGDDTYETSTVKTEWAKLGENGFIDVHVKVALPKDAGNDYQEQEWSITYTVEAVQANAEMPKEWDGETVTKPEGLGAINDTTAGEIHIKSAAELVYVMEETAQRVNSPYFAKTFILDCDIDFDGQEITGFGSQYGNILFDFDGNGHTISNFVINETNEWYAGLFQQFGGTVKNLTVANATVTGNRMVGVIASNVEGANAQMINCHVKNCTVISNMKKAGALTGYVASGAKVDGCSATDCVVYCASAEEGESGTLVGYNSASTVTDNNAETNVSINRGVSITAVSNAADLATALTNGGNVLLLNDLTLSNWNTVEIKNKNLILYGNNKTISGLTTPLINFYGGTCTINDLTVKDSTVVANSGILGAGVILEQAQWANLYMSNCHVKNCKLTGGDTRAAALVGYWIGGGEIKNCSVEDCEITANGTVGGIVGHRQVQSDYVAEANITNCSVKECELTSYDDSYRVGAIIGTASTGDTIVFGCTSTGNSMKQVNGTNEIDRPAGQSELYGRTVSGGTISVN